MVSQATDTRERVRVVEGGKPPSAEGRPLPQSADKDANIFLRLWRIEHELGAVEKSQVATVKMEGGGGYTYKYSGHDVVIAAVNPLLARHGVKVWPTTIAHERIGNMTVLTLKVEFVNVDNPADRCAVEMVNYGADKGDKGASKATTNAMREAIKKALNITSEEDKRADETTEFQSSEGATRAEVDAAKEFARDNLEKWATTFKTALENAQTVKDVERLERDNKAQLISEQLPAVTRAFFADLITKRKRELSK